MTTKAELQKEIYRLSSELALERRIADYLLSKMVDMTKGVAIKPDYYNGQWDQAMKHSAGLALIQVNEMRRKK